MARGLVERQLLGWKEFQVRNEAAFATDLLWRGLQLDGRENAAGVLHGRNGRGGHIAVRPRKRRNG
jgi:hypothetical protein